MKEWSGHTETHLICYVLTVIKARIHKYKVMYMFKHYRGQFHKQFGLISLIAKQSGMSQHYVKQLIVSKDESLVLCEIGSWNNICFLPCFASNVNDQRGFLDLWY